MTWLRWMGAVFAAGGAALAALAVGGCGSDVEVCQSGCGGGGTGSATSSGSQATSGPTTGTGSQGTGGGPMCFGDPGSQACSCGMVQLPADCVNGEWKCPPCTLCGGAQEPPCPDGEYCDYEYDHCGTPGQGFCHVKPQGCDLIYNPVCACDGKVYGNACAAAQAGVDTDKDAICKAPDGTFGCGDTFCALKSQYCELDEIGNLVTKALCKPIPSACPAGGESCACLGGETCGSMCSGAAAGGITLVCMFVD